MAHLNLRDRRIETTIAYVGAAADDGAANFEHVSRERERGRAGSLAHTVVDGARVVSLEWRPRDAARLNDCELSVKLVAPEGPMDAEAMQRVLVDADGLVLMLDADAESAPQNERALAAVREAMARAPEKKLPVVVQVNRREGADDAAEVDLAREWPSVRACAAKGEGVMETLERAVGVVVESMQSQASQAPPARPAAATRTEGNPLLVALRQVLVATVSEQIASLEARLVERLTSRTESGDAGAGDALRAATTELVARLDRVDRAVADVAKRVERIEARAPATRAEVEAAVESRVAAAAGATREVVAADLKEQRRTLRDETARAAAATQTIQRAIEALAGDLKKWTAGEATATILAGVDSLAARVGDLRGQLESLSLDARAAAKRVDGLAFDMEKMDARSQQRALEAKDDARAAAEMAEGRAEALRLELGTLVEELRKPKKSWFT